MNANRLAASGANLAIVMTTTYLPLRINPGTNESDINQGEIMTKAFAIATLLVAAYAHINWAMAQTDTNNSIKVVSNDDTRCRKNVVQYTETLKFVRQSAGEQVSVNVMSSYVPLEQLNQVVSNSGYCAGEQLLRDKKALR